MGIFEQIVSGLFTVVVTSLGAWVWNVSNKVATLEANQTATKLLETVKDDGLKALLEEKFKQVEFRLVRIESKLNNQMMSGD